MVDELIEADFDRARQKAFFRELTSYFRRDSNDLVSFHEFRKRVSPERESYRGVQSVPVAEIIGSVDRFRDFDRAFLPRRRNTAGRWKNVDRAYYEDVRLPPIQLYKVGGVYFVKDGNHRVSVARERGVEFIDAEVIEGHIRLPLYASMSPSELLLQSEYAEFLRRTNLDRLRPEHDIRPTALGRYDELWDHILLHQEWLSEREGGAGTVSEAVLDWYDNLYLPIVTVVRERGVARRFPGRTEADIYLWVTHHRDELDRRYGHEVPPAESAADYAEAVERESKLSRRLQRATKSAGRQLRRAVHLSEPAAIEEP